jgi:hypothetical protein
MEHIAVYHFLKVFENSEEKSEENLNKYLKKKKCIQVTEQTRVI